MGAGELPDDASAAENMPITMVKVREAVAATVAGWQFPHVVYLPLGADIAALRAALERISRGESVRDLYQSDHALVNADGPLLDTALAADSMPITILREGDDGTVTVRGINGSSYTVALPAHATIAELRAALRANGAFSRA